MQLLTLVSDMQISGLTLNLPTLAERGDYTRIPEPIRILSEIGGVMLSILPNRTFRVFSLPLIATVLLICSGCAGRDATTMQASLAASTLQLAEQANAPQLAPSEYNTASETVASAQQAVAEKDWDKAQQHGQLGEAQAALSLHKAEKAHTQSRLDAVALLPVQ